MAECEHFAIRDILGALAFIFTACMTGKYNPDEYTETELEYIRAHQDYTIESFDIGLEIIGKLRPVRIPGGVVLEDTTFKMLNV